MIAVVDLRLMELLAARLCHELIGPMTAVVNGVDLFREANSEIDREAIALVGESARRANCRLQFYRFAYGFAGDGGLAGPPPCALAAEFFEGSRVTCEYGEAVRALPLIEQKLGCNLLALGAEMLGRGGRLALDVAPSGLRLEATGERAAPSRDQLAALSLTAPVTELTPRTVQGYFTSLLARGLGLQLVVEAVAPRGLYLIATAAQD